VGIRLTVYNNIGISESEKLSINQESVYRKEIEIELRYESDGRTPVITEVSRISKPGRRVYSKKDDIPRVMQGRGVIVMSTSKGIMSGDDARKKGLGGEVLLKTW